MENKTTNSEKMSKKTVHKRGLRLVKRHREPPVLLTLISDFPGWLAWFSLQIFCLNYKIHFSLANANNSASFKRKNGLNFTGFVHSQTTNKLVNEAVKDSRPAGKIVKNRPLSKPIRLDDLEDCARSQAYKKKK